MAKFVVLCMSVSPPSWEYITDHYFNTRDDARCFIMQEARYQMNIETMQLERNEKAFKALDEFENNEAANSLKTTYLYQIREIKLHEFGNPGYGYV